MKFVHFVPQTKTLKLYMVPNTIFNMKTSSYTDYSVYGLSMMTFHNNKKKHRAKKGV